MAKKCKITGKGPLTGYSVSHAHNKTKKTQLPNLQWKRIYVPEEDRWVRVRLSTRGLRAVTKVGLLAYLRKNGMSIADVTA